MRFGRFAAAAALVVVVGCGPESPGELADLSAITADRVIPTGQACTPTGKHLEHRSVACATCHLCAGTVSFTGSVAGANAAFDAGTKNCSNIACHAVPAGTFTYTVWDWGSEEVVAVTVPYGGAAGASQPNWYGAGGMGCATCHGYPPRYAGIPYTWHSGLHASGISNGNTCQLCHPDASGAYVYGGPPSFTGTSGGQIASCPPGTYCASAGAITNASLHGNGTLDVSPGWSSACFGCH
jgi:predicted CxxxxCH...CXXCH cytochrome family protein